MNVEIFFDTNACQAGLPNRTKFNQTVHLADESRREEKRERREAGKYAASFSIRGENDGKKKDFNELIKFIV